MTLPKKLIDDEFTLKRFSAALAANRTCRDVGSAMGWSRGKVIRTLERNPGLRKGVLELIDAQELRIVRDGQSWYKVRLDDELRHLRRLRDTWVYRTVVADMGQRGGRG